MPDVHVTCKFCATETIINASRAQSPKQKNEEKKNGYIHIFDPDVKDFVRVIHFLLSWRTSISRNIHIEIP